MTRSFLASTAMILTVSAYAAEPGDVLQIKPVTYSEFTVNLKTDGVSTRVALAAKDRFAWRELMKLNKAKDTDGIGALVAKDEVFAIESADVIVLEKTTRRTDEHESYEVRITSGKHAKKKAIVAEDNLIKK